MFTPEKFLQQTVTGAMSTAQDPVPASSYIGVIERLVPRKATEAGNVPCDVFFNIDDADLKARMGRAKVTSRLTIWLDFKEDGETLDNGKGKNVSLGRLREACGQNDPSKPWNPSMLLGKPLRIEVINETDDDGNIRDRVKSFAKL